MDNNNYFCKFITGMFLNMDIHVSEQGHNMIIQVHMEKQGFCHGHHTVR